MNTRSSSNNLVSPLSNPERIVRNNHRVERSLLGNFKEINMSNLNPNQIPPPMGGNRDQGPPPLGPIPTNQGPPPVVRPDEPAPDLRTMEELCQPTMYGWGRPIAPVNIRDTDFRLKNHMIQQVQNSCQFYELSGDDANKHLGKYLTVTQSMKQHGVTDDALRLYLFPYSLGLHATAWFDRLPKNSIHNFNDMVSKFLAKYFPPLMVTKLRNEISNFRQLPGKSLSEAWERYKLSIDQCPNHNMLLVTQIDTFYNGLTLTHRDTINAAAGGTFMKRRPEECYDLIKNMTAHHNYWDTSAKRSESTKSTTSSSSEIVVFTKKMDDISTALLRMSQSSQQVNIVSQSCETCGGPHRHIECPATDGYTQEICVAQGDRNLLSYCSNNYLGPPGFNQPNSQNTNNMTQNQANHGNYNQNQGYNQNRGNQYNQGNQNYQAPLNQTQVITTMRAELRNEISTTVNNQNNKLESLMNGFIQKINPSSSGSLPSNTIANPRGDLKDITTLSGVAYEGPPAPSTSSPHSKDVERVLEVTKDTV
ncbi:reverse transcriptase domain-containing protein [Tanacetum coccineum]|uniref:Reverse transcriptase domain-containing protein n=1 Tax=Tanacetum coccineum TaxID=301880 RepID=A0ABQ4WX85_9ASTR